MSGAGDDRVSGPRRGPPLLRPFGLVLHHDGSWSHEGQPIRNRRLREHFERSVRYLPDERCHVVTLRQFRGQIVVEEAGFFVRSVDLATGTISLSDAGEELLDPATLRVSPLDGALLCTVKRDLAPPDGVVARFLPAAHAELLLAVELADADNEPIVELAGQVRRLPRGVFDAPHG